MTAPQKRAFITGITGQDGSLLAQFLLEKGYEVHGLRLYSATDDTQRIELIDTARFFLHYGDLTDGGNIWKLLKEIRPHEIYNFGAMSHVQVSFQTPEAAADINALGTLRLLEAVHGLGLQDHCRFYQASSSEMFGNQPGPQNENTPFAPCSPYGIAKLYAYWMTRNYRETYGLHASNGILFNHESPLRGEHFLTRKVARSIAAIATGHQDVLKIGNLESRRDWGHARDYVEGVWMMLQQDTADDYVLATGQAYSVRDFITAAFDCAGMSLDWSGEGLSEKACDRKTGRCLVEVDPAFFRPAELHELVGDASRARRKLGWAPRVSFIALVREMVEAEMNAIREEGGYAEYLHAAE